MYEDKNIEIKKRVKPLKKKEKKVKVKKTLAKRKINLPTIPPVFENVNWKAVLMKLIILFAILFLIVFTISRIQNASQNKQEDNNYSDNLTYLTNSILNYYNTKKLPKKSGDSISMIFREMLDFNIIKEIKPNETETYDIQNSYVIVTKEDNDFKFRINLKWSDKELTFTQYITCTEKNCSLKK